MTRPHQVAFAQGERLFRRIEKGALDREGKKIKHTSLRLQISVDRESFARIDDLPPASLPKFNGVAAIRAGAARTIGRGPVCVVCVDEPSKEDDAHALIAVVTSAEPAAEIEADVGAARMLIAQKMEVVVSPT